MFKKDFRAHGHDVLLAKEEGLALVAKHTLSLQC